MAAIKTKGPKSLRAHMSEGENLSVDIQLHYLVTVNYISKPYQCQRIDYWSSDTLGANSSPAEVSIQ